MVAPGFEPDSWVPQPMSQPPYLTAVRLHVTKGYEGSAMQDEQVLKT